MASETAGPPTTNELLVRLEERWGRLDERWVMMNESLHDIKDEVVSIRSEVRISQNQAREETTKRIDECISPIIRDVEQLKLDMRSMHDMRAGFTVGEKVIGVLLILLNAYIAYK